MPCAIRGCAVSSVPIAVEPQASGAGRIRLANFQGIPARLRSHVARSPQLVSGVAICTIVIFAATLADFLTPQSPLRMRMRDALQPPSILHWFGTDNLGRDVASRVLHGAQISLGIGFSTMVATAALGTAIGLLAGYFPRADGPLMRVMDAFMAFPAIMLAVGITAAIGPSGLNAIAALTAVYVPRTSRVVRGSVLALRRLEFIEAAIAIGGRHRRVLLRHILPNCLGPLLVQVAFVFAYAILSEAALSFLGMGTPPPTPTLGSVIADGRDYVREAPWICFFPGMTLLFAVLGLNMLGDGLRELLDPHRSAVPS